MSDETSYEAVTTARFLYLFRRDINASSAGTMLFALCSFAVLHPEGFLEMAQTTTRFLNKSVAETTPPDHDCPLIQLSADRLLALWLSAKGEAPERQAT